MRKSRTRAFENSTFRLGWMLMLLSPGKSLLCTYVPNLFRNPHRRLRKWQRPRYLVEPHLRSDVDLAISHKSGFLK